MEEGACALVGVASGAGDGLVEDANALIGVASEKGKAVDDNAGPLFKSA